MSRTVVDTARLREWARHLGNPTTDDRPAGLLSDLLEAAADRIDDDEAARLSDEQAVAVLVMARGKLAAAHPTFRGHAVQLSEGEREMLAGIIAKLEAAGAR